MFKRILRSTLVAFISLLSPTNVFSSTLFDFDEIQATSKKGATAPAVEVYMEGLYGSNLSVSRGATAVQGPSFYNNADLDNSYLTVGKGKGPAAIVISFDDPIESFSVDFRLFRKAKSFAILADGVLINHQTLTRAQKKSGLSGHQTYFFDTPVHSLQFISSKKKSFAIDNLLVNLPSDLDGGFGLGFGNGSGSFFTENPFGLDDFGIAGFSDQLGDTYIGDTSTFLINQITADVPEPSSMLLLVLGALGLMFFIAAQCRAPCLLRNETASCHELLNDGFSSRASERVLIMPCPTEGSRAHEVLNPSALS